MTHFSKEEIQKLGLLCKIACNEEEAKALGHDLESIMLYFEHLNDIDTEGLEPLYSVAHEHKHLLRDDTEGELLSREAFLANAPSHIGGMIRVPPVLKAN